jgi:HNH endonuclease
MGVRGIVHREHQRRPLSERLMGRVQKTESCWLWTGTRNPKGYGRIKVNEGRKLIPVHRAAYETFVGPIPDGLTIDHLCKQRNCVNPAHLEAVPFKENVLRGSGPAALNARKTHCNRGHLLIPENLCGRSDRRECKLCQKIHQRKNNAKRSAIRRAMRTPFSRTNGKPFIGPFPKQSTT